MRAVSAGLTVLALAAAASWGGGEIVARGASAAFAQLAAEGRGAVAQVSSTGFPLRIGARLSGLELSDPAAGLHWTVPAAQVAAPLWAPLDWRADLEVPQKLTIGGQRFTLTATQAQGDIGLGLGADLPVRNAGLRLDAPALVAQTATAPALAAEALTLAATGEGASYAIDATAQALSLPAGSAARFAPGADLPDTIETVTAEGALDFAAPLALRQAVAPALTGLRLDAARIRWGGQEVSASGQLAIDARGRPEGTINFATKDWAGWLKVAVAAGLVRRDQLPMLTSLGTYLAAQSPEGAVTVPLAFAGGVMSLGPVPLGPAPVLR